jgi:2'-5' RNA ligase
LAGYARFVPRENYHATLAFVGEVAESQIGVLQWIGAARRARDCTIEFSQLDWRETCVVAAAASDIPPELVALWSGLQRELEGQVKPRGTPPRAPLRLHVTLARKVLQAPVLTAMSPFSWHARSFSLLRSDTSGAPSVYTVVDTWPLLYETPHPRKISANSSHMQRALGAEYEIMASHIVEENPWKRIAKKRSRRR